MSICTMTTRDTTRRSQADRDIHCHGLGRRKRDWVTQKVEIRHWHRPIKSAGL